jgi:Predicted ATPase (AAA+ superfamily)
MKPRFLSQLLPSPDIRGLVLLTGARQTGKTTLVKYHYNDLRYINFDALEYREKVAGIHSDQWANTVGTAIIDEAQKLPLVFEKSNMLMMHSN